MAKAILCNLGGDDDLAVYVISDPDTGQVITPCVSHWVAMCIVEAESHGWTAPVPPAEPEFEPEQESAGALPDIPDPPSPMTERVVRRGQTRRRSKPEQRAIHAKAADEARPANDS